MSDCAPCFCERTAVPKLDTPEYFPPFPRPLPGSHSVDVGTLSPRRRHPPRSHYSVRRRAPISPRPDVAVARPPPACPPARPVPNGVVVVVRGGRASPTPARPTLGCPPRGRRLRGAPTWRRLTVAGEAPAGCGSDAGDQDGGDSDEAGLPPAEVRRRRASARRSREK